MATQKLNILAQEDVMNIKLKTRVRKADNKLMISFPSSAIWALGLREGDVLELDIQGEDVIMTRKLDHVQYIDKSNVDLYKVQVESLTRIE